MSRFMKLGLILSVFLVSVAMALPGPASTARRSARTDSRIGYYLRWGVNESCIGGSDWGYNPDFQDYIVVTGTVNGDTWNTTSESFGGSASYTGAGYPTQPYCTGSQQGYVTSEFEACYAESGCPLLTPVVQPHP